MNKEITKNNISSYQFLFLFSVIETEKKELIIFDSNELMKSIAKYVKEKKFASLFEDISVKNGFALLNEAFDKAYAFGLLTPIHDTYNRKTFIINISDDQIQNLKSQFKSENIELMNDLVSLINNDINTKKNIANNFVDQDKIKNQPSKNIRIKM